MSTKKTAIATDKAPSAIGPYSQGIQAGGLVFVSGQLPLDPASGEFVAGGIEEHMHQVCANALAVLAAAGGTADDVIKTTVFLADMADFQAVNGVYAQYFDETPPARSAVQVAALPKGADVEMELIAYVAGR